MESSPSIYEPLLLQENEDSEKPPLRRCELRVSKTRMTIDEPFLFQRRGNSSLTIFSQFPSQLYFYASLLTLAFWSQFFLAYPQEGQISRHKIIWSLSFAAPTLGLTNSTLINPLSLFIHPFPTGPTDIFTCPQRTLKCTSLHYPHTKSLLADASPQQIINTNL
jgi:hypothetical protein